MRTAREFLAQFALFLHKSASIQDELDDATGKQYPPPQPPDPSITPITIKGLFPDRIPAPPRPPPAQYLPLSNKRSDGRIVED